jgi:pteridine reductase
MMTKNILITGGAKRVGAYCARYLHGQGHNILLHYRRSKNAAEKLAAELNQQRQGSVTLFQADLLDFNSLQLLADEAMHCWGGIDVLINNASAFYATPIKQEITECQWDDLMGSNLKAPFFLSQKLSASLRKNQGCIINMLDIHAEYGLINYPIYSIAKAGLANLTKIMAKELAPNIRVNAIAPGVILWPEQVTMSDVQKQKIQAKIALQKIGKPHDIAQAIQFFIENSPYITGQILTIDGGRTLFS